MAGFCLTLGYPLKAQTDTTQAGTPGPGALPVVTLSAAELEGDQESQDISGLLQSSRDIFVSTAGYTLSSARFRIRGYDSENTLVMINGVPVNDPESGRAYWSSWGGLNDVTRYQEVRTGISASQQTFGGIGGSTNVETRASGFRKGSQISYSIGNRSYRNRLMFTSNTGMLKNGWSFSLSASRRWAQEGYVEGTFYDAWAYFLAAEKKISAKHTLAFTGFASPSRQGRPGVSTQEAYDLAGSNFYNPYWGYQEGEKRNSRVSTSHQPMLILGHYWDINGKTKFYQALSYSFGRSGFTALEWYDAADPRPDYYRNLPSYYVPEDPAMAAVYTDNWQEEDFRQLDWERFYFANRKNLYTVLNANGIDGNSITGNRSKYIIEDRRVDKSQIGYSANLRHALKENLFLSAGANVSVYRGRNYKVIEDLLGGDFWVDVDKYAEQDYLDPVTANNDTRIPNHVIYEGDAFGYDYTASIDQADLFAMLEFKASKLDGFVGITAAGTRFWRTGHMQSGKFPEDSYGDSDIHSFLTYGTKAGLQYKLTGRHFITANGLWMTRPPFYRDAFVSIRTRDQVVEDLGEETVYGGDINYIYRGTGLKLRLTGYYSKFMDQNWSRSFYHEDLNTFVNYIMTGLDEVHTGMELGIEAVVTPALTASVVAAHADYVYSSRPDVFIAADNDPSVLLESRKAYLKNFKVGGMPESAFSIGLKYNSRKFWFAGITWSYFDNIYLNPNPDRRTEEALAGLVSDDPQWEALLSQEKLDAGMTLDFFGGKSWTVKGHYINLTVNVSNLLNEADFAIGGFEQFRYDPRDLDRFPPKLYYLYGRSYFINVRYTL